MTLVLAGCWEGDPKKQRSGNREGRRITQGRLMSSNRSSGGRESTLRLGAVKDSQNSEKLLHLLQFITVKGHRLIPAEGKAVQGRVRESPGTSFQSSSPQGVLWTARNPPSNSVWQHTRSGANRGSSLKPWCPEYSWELSHRGMADRPSGLP